MKRKEMVEIILDYLNDVIISSDHATPVQASVLLSILEKNGMIPPTTVVELGDGIYQDNCWDKEEK